MGQLITPEFAAELCRTYIKDRSAIISAAIGYDDANAVWYSIEELENYLSYVKTEAANMGYVADGIRCYLGVYPDDPIYGDQAGMSNVFFSPTGYVEGGAPGKSDIATINPMNHGTMGNPPIIEYPQI